MTEKTEPPTSWAGQWLRFLELRRKMEENIKALELSDSSLSFGIKTEREFRDRLRQLQSQLDQVVALLGKPEENYLVR